MNTVSEEEEVEDDEDVEDDEEDVEKPKEKIQKKERPLRKKVDEDDKHEGFTNYTTGVSGAFGGDYLLLDH